MLCVNSSDPILCFSRRCSSGSTIGITTLSCPSCSTEWVSLCPAGSEKSWSTPGSSTSGGDHSFACCSTPLRTLASMSDVSKIKNSTRYEFKLNPAWIHNGDLPGWTGQPRMASEKESAIAPGSSPLPLICETLLPHHAGQTWYAVAVATAPAVSWRRETLCDAQEGP